MASRSKLSKTLALLMTGGIATAVVIALAVPATLLASLLFGTFVGDFESLPTALRNPPTPQSTYVYAADGKTLLTVFYDQNRRDVTFEQIPQVMREAIIAAEDTRFYSHHGVDPKGVARALVSDVSGGHTQGASTLTMQYVRNVLLYTADSEADRDAATEITPGRKLREMRYALAIETKLAKDEILRRYLNIAYFGHGAYGIYSASQTYFSKDPSDLTVEEASLLAGLVKAPAGKNSYDPAEYPEAATDRRGWVLKRMADMHYIDQPTADAAAATPIALKLHATPEDCQAGGNKAGWGFFCGYLKSWWMSQPAFGANVKEREARLQRGGYTIVTSLDPELQRAAEKNIADQLDKNSRFAMNIAAVEPKTGRIRAMATNRNYSVDISANGVNSAGKQYGKGSYPNTVNPLISGSDAATGYQAGSTFKLFTMLAALEAGKPLNTYFNAPSKFISEYPAAPGPATCGGFYCPSNANPKWMDGPRTMWDAFGRSVNTYFVWLEQQVGAEKVVEMAQRLGIQFRASSDATLAKPENAESWGAFTLGVSSTSPLDLANAYATVAADGQYCTPLPVTSITDAEGVALDVARPQCKQVIDPQVARAATDAARCPVGGYSVFGKCDQGTAPEVRGIVGRPVAGKTGTTENDSTGSLAAYTPNLAVAGIVADPDNPQNLAGPANAQRVIVATARTLRDAERKLPVKDFPAPDRKMAFGSQSGSYLSDRPGSSVGDRPGRDS